MDKERCLAAGKWWDPLLRRCRTKISARPKPTVPAPELNRSHVTQARTKYLSPVVQLRATSQATKFHPEMVLGPALWIFVILAMLGSILALALWFIIYRQQTRPSSTPGDPEPQQEPLQKPEPPVIIHSLPTEISNHAEMMQRAAGAHSPCVHMYPGAQMATRWEEGFTACRDPTRHAGTEVGGGLLTCCTAREHRVPLPATELGGTVLVTTKTV
uniref:uncharacterized protein n=1 Tax=Semicossyphus pulcher TaxID=241346 RepID=UPI0037E906D9